MGKATATDGDVDQILATHKHEQSRQFRNPPLILAEHDDHDTTRNMEGGFLQDELPSYDIFEESFQPEGDYIVLDQYYYEP